MINLPASQLTLSKITKSESENMQAASIYKKYERCLDQATQDKKDLILVRKALKRGEMDSKNLASALELEVIFKSDAIENWNLAQVELQKYNDFQLNRKYKN